MITKQPGVFLLPNSKARKFFERFEAIEYAKTPSDISEIWKRNKTPVIDPDKFPVSELSSYTLIEIPKSLICDEKGFVEFSHNHGIECGEFDTGARYDLSSAHCFLCSIANYNGHPSAAEHNMYAKPVDMIIYESPNFYVVSELGALKLGYLMIVSKKHYLAVAELPKNLMDEYGEVCRHVEKMLLKAFNGSTVSFMEHGTGYGKASHKSSIVHLHVHVVVDFHLKKKYRDMVQMRRCANISEAKGKYYFSYQEGAEGELWISDDENTYRNRQLPRQAMAENLELPPEQFNWRNNECPEMVFATLGYLHEMLKNETTGCLYDRTQAFVTTFGKRFR